MEAGFIQLTERNPDIFPVCGMETGDILVYGMKPGNFPVHKKKMSEQWKT